MSEVEKYDRGQMINPATDSWTAVTADVYGLANAIAHTEFVPAGLRGKDGAKVAAAILTGRELGLPPMTSLSSIHVINGKPGISAEMMRALVLQAGHEIVVSEVGTQRVVIKGRRESTTEWTTVSWSDQDAKRAGLQGGNYAKYPRQMLTARATTELCRLIFADVIHGLRSVEELEYLEPDEVLVGEVVEPDAPAAPAGQGRTVGRKKAAPKQQPVDAQAEQEQGEKPVETTPERRRPTVTKRGAQTAPEAKPVQSGTDAPPGAGAVSGEGAAVAAAPSPEPDDEIHEAEIVEEDPAPEVETLPEDESEPRITDQQRKLVLVRFDQLQVPEREARLEISSVLVGRRLTSANDMTRREAGHLIETLARCQSHGDLELVVDATRKQQEPGQ